MQRIKVVQLRDATDADGAADESSDGKKLVFMSVLLSNGTHATPTYKIKNINPSIIQGGATRQTALFEVDSDFVHAKLIIECATCGSKTTFRPVRVTLSPA